MIEFGSLKDFKLFDILSILCQSKKSGLLSLTLGNNIGTISLFEGDLIEANFCSSTGDIAFCEMALYDSGEFKFTENLLTSTNNKINKSLEELLEEANLIVELTNILIKRNIADSFKAEIIIVNYKEDPIINLISKGFTSIIDIAKEINLDSNAFSKQLETLIKDNYVRIKESHSYNIWNSFQKIVNKLYNEFISISGIKMTTNLENKIQDLIKVKSLNLEFKDGKIDTRDLFKLAFNEQLEIYKVFIQDLSGYIVKIYGHDFVESIFSELKKNDLKVKDLLDKINS